MGKALIIGNIAGAGYRVKKSLSRAGLDTDILISDNDLETQDDPSWEDTDAINGREYTTYMKAFNFSENSLIAKNSLTRQLYLYSKIRKFVKKGNYTLGIPIGIWPIIFHDLKIPYVWLCAGSDVREALAGDSVISKLMQNAMKSCIGVVTPADNSMLEVLRKYIPEDKMLFIPNYPIDVDIYQKSDVCPEPFRIYHPARHLWYGLESTVSKANNCLIEAVGELSKEFDLHLEMASWGIHLDHSMNLVKKIGLEDKVSWHGLISKPEMAVKYQNSSCVVDHVGWGMVSQTSMEGLACGKPVLANMSSSVTDHFPDIPIMNVHDTQSCYEALHSLISNKDFYDSKRKISHSWVRDNWSVQVMGDKIINFFGLR